MLKLKKLVKVLAISSSIILLSSCSAKHKNMDQASMGDVNGVEASGVAQESNFGSDAAAGSQHASRNGNTYYFDFDKSDVHEGDKPAIMAKAESLASNPHAKVIVEGHTDPKGSREYNVALGERRANAVAGILQTKGVNSDQARVVSYGAERLAAPGRSEQDYELDRRAVIASQN